MKKLRLFILILFMIFTVLPVSIKAEGDTLEPDVSVFATKDDMMGETFSPNENGVPENIGKIAFGKNANNKTQEWYVLGADSGVNDGKNNTVIFAADNIRNSPFSNISNNDYSSDVNTARLFMQAMVDVNTTEFFTSHEIELMNKTTITAYQTISDELYLLSADGINSNIIKAGSNDQIKLAMNSYWKNGEDFWLRTNYGTGVLYADTGNVTSSTTHLSESGFLRPAFNLNLTNVLFASAAKDNENGKIDANDAMTLRFDGSNIGIGSATVYSDHIEIKKGTNGTDTALFVQGKNGDVNWSYRKGIPNNGSVNKVTKTDIINALTSLSITDIDLSKCKVWLEITDIEQSVKYAVEAKQAISRVSINISNPVPGKSLAEEINKSTTDVNYTASSIEWNTTDETAGYYKEYTASVTLTPKTGYAFIDMYIDGSPIKTSASVNGFDATSVTKNTDGTLTITYEFEPTAKDEFVKAYDPYPITVENGTSLEDIKALIPETVKVDTKGQGKIDKPVSWNPGADIYTSYDPIKKDSQSFIIDGGVNLGESISYSNDGPPQVKLSIIVEAAEVVPTPTPVPPSSSNNPNTGNTTDDGYVVPNTGVK